MHTYFKLYMIIWGGMSLFTLILYVVDKIKAIRHSWRIKESVLLLFTVLLGSVGALIGIQVFRHKTKHWYFQVVCLASLVIHLICAIKLFFIK